MPSAMSRSMRAAGGQGRSEVKQAAGAGREHYRPGAAFAVATQRGRVGNQTFRRRHAAKQASWLGSGWIRVLALIFAGSVVAVVVVAAMQRFLEPDLALESAPSQAVVEPEQQEAAQEAVHPENDVAKERAALDAPPNQ